jgi:hypothetical protein
MPNPVAAILKKSRASWWLLAQSTIWIAAVIAGFMLPPPVGTVEETKVWVRFAQFVITVLIGLFVLAELRWNRKKDSLGWGSLSALFLVLGTAVFFSYQFFAARWTAPYSNQRVVIGDTFTQLGGQYHRENPNLTMEDLVMHYAGHIEKIWTRESLQQRRVLLAGLYILAMPLFTICIMSIVQAMQCAASSSPRKRARTPRSASVN